MPRVYHDRRQDSCEDRSSPGQQTDTDILHGTCINKGTHGKSPQNTISGIPQQNSKAGSKHHIARQNRKGLDKLLDEVEEWAPSYNEGSIFKETPEEVALYLDNISNLQKLLKKNPNYKPSYDGWFASFREKVKKEAAENGVEIK